jgi:protein SCO1/2
VEAGSVKFFRDRLAKDPIKGSVKRSRPVAVLPVLALAMALFPRCPVCWSAYLSVFGIAGLEQLPYSPWLLPVLACLILVNLGSLWLQSRGQVSTQGFFFAAAGAFMILVPGMSFGLEYAGLAGVILTLTGSLLSVFSSSLRSARET